MAVGYKYWLVYLSDFNRDSFLLFVHNPAGSTKLRDYSGEKVKVLGQPPVRAVVGATTEGRPRFEIDPHETTDFYYWHKETSRHNARYLTSAQSILASIVADQTPTNSGTVAPSVTSRRAHRGCPRQLQDYVNAHEAELTD
jgi:hypothetical protein